jgi:hypothetical protein
VITGFNTDIEWNGVVYHVQTEDKGLETPLILSLVYTGGRILASKRTPYNDLIAAGFDEVALAERLNRQHKILCAAIKSGRVEDVIKLSQRDNARKNGETEAETAPVAAPEVILPADAVTVLPSPAPNREPSGPAAFLFFEPPGAPELVLLLKKEQPLIAGSMITLDAQVRGGAQDKSAKMADVEVTVKIMGTSFRPFSYTTTTDEGGWAHFIVSLPNFSNGRAALLVKAEKGGQIAELRRIIQPSKKSDF